jgi:hypothetical protein
MRLTIDRQSGTGSMTAGIGRQLGAASSGFFRTIASDPPAGHASACQLVTSGFVPSLFVASTWMRPARSCPQRPPLRSGVRSVGSRHHGFACFPYSVISMARFSPGTAGQSAMPPSVRRCTNHETLIVIGCNEYIGDSSASSVSSSEKRFPLPIRVGRFETQLRLRPATYGLQTQPAGSG